MGYGITNNEYVFGSLCLVQGVDTLYNSGPYVDDQSGMKIKVRGNSSAQTINKPFKVKLQKKADLLGRGNDDYKDKEWALLNYNATRNLTIEMGYRIGSLVGMPWEPAHQYANLVLNGRYMGLYMLCETVKRSDVRCDIKKTGFLVEADPYWWNTQDSTFHTSHQPYAFAYTFKYPDEIEDQTTERVSQIRDYIEEFEDSLYNGRDVSGLIDMDSWVSWMVAQDLLGTLDGAGSNIYLSKKNYDPADPKSSKLKLGPIWDTDSSFQRAGQWATSHGMVYFYFSQLFQNRAFVEAYVAAYNRVRPQVMPYVEAVTDSLLTHQGAAIDQSRQLTFAAEPYYTYETLADNVSVVRDWFTERLAWMDEAVPQLLSDLDTAIGEVETTHTSAPVAAQVYSTDGVLLLTLQADEAAQLLRQGTAYLPLPGGVYLIKVLHAHGPAKCLKWVKTK